jgi:hypothetical protein
MWVREGKAEDENSIISQQQQDHREIIFNPSETPQEETTFAAQTYIGCVKLTVKTHEIPPRVIDSSKVGLFKCLSSDIVDMIGCDRLQLFWIDVMLALFCCIVLPVRMLLLVFCLVCVLSCASSTAC